MKVLLAEDDASIRTIAAMALSRVGGFDVFCAADGLETIALVRLQNPDLILLDVMMPRLDGFETCTRLKADELTREIPVIFLTARAQAHEIRNGMSRGAIGYILKPFNPMTLHQQIEEAVRNHAKRG